MDEAHVQGEGVDSMDEATKCPDAQESEDTTLKYVIVLVFLLVI